VLPTDPQRSPDVRRDLVGEHSRHTNRPPNGSQALSPTNAIQDRKGLALLLLAAAQFVVVLDASIVNVALPSIGRDLHFSENDLSWVVNAYTLTFGGFLLLGGRMADLLGRRRLFVSGLILFALASLAGGLAQSSGWLIAARAVQGVGAALLSPAALSIITTTFTEGAERNRALGVWGAVAGSGGAAGVLLGGMLTQWAGWQWVLFVNVPIGFAAAAGSMAILRESRTEGPRHFDVAGALSVTAGLSLLVYTLVRANVVGWGATQTIVLGAVALGLIALFVAIERRTRAPLVPFPGIFRSRTITGINITGLFIAMALFSMFFFISLYMQQVLGYDALKAGISYLPLAGGIIVSAGLAAQLVTRFGFKPVLIAGLLVTAAGLVWFGQVSPHGSYLGDILFPSLLAAIGLGLSFVPMTVAAVAGVRPEEAGLASGLINTSQQVGGALGLAILATIANAHTTSVLKTLGHAPGAFPTALTEGFQAAFRVGAGFALVGAVLAAVVISGRQSREHAASAQAEGREAEPVPVSA
jgi:EmrB/QacA subfamily drug resistance transporter